MFSREIEPKGYIKGDLLWYLVHMITETEICHDIPSARWRSRKASGRIRSKSEGPRLRGADDVTSSLSTKAQDSRAQMSNLKNKWMSQLKERG